MALLGVGMKCFGGVHTISVLAFLSLASSLKNREKLLIETHIKEIRPWDPNEVSCQFGAIW